METFLKSKKELQYWYFPNRTVSEKLRMAAFKTTSFHDLVFLVEVRFTNLLFSYHFSTVTLPSNSSVTILKRSMVAFKFLKSGVSSSIALICSLSLSNIVMKSYIGQEKLV